MGFGIEPPAWILVMLSFAAATLAAASGVALLRLWYRKGGAQLFGWAVAMAALTTAGAAQAWHLTGGWHGPSFRFWFVACAMVPLWLGQGLLSAASGSTVSMRPLRHAGVLFAMAITVLLGAFAARMELAPQRMSGAIDRIDAAPGYSVDEVAALAAGLVDVAESARTEDFGVPSSSPAALSLVAFAGGDAVLPPAAVEHADRRGNASGLVDGRWVSVGSEGWLAAWGVDLRNVERAAERESLVAVDRQMAGRILWSAPTVLALAGVVDAAPRGLVAVALAYGTLLLLVAVLNAIWGRARGRTTSRYAAGRLAVAIGGLLVAVSALVLPHDPLVVHLAAVLASGAVFAGAALVVRGVPDRSAQSAAATHVAFPRGARVESPE